jgi:hypothetical protein
MVVTAYSSAVLTPFSDLGYPGQKENEVKAAGESTPVNFLFILFALIIIPISS